MGETFDGVAGAPGVAIGPLVLLARAPVRDAPPDQRSADLDRDTIALAKAQSAVAAQLARLADDLRARGNVEEAAIFDAQSLLATDPALADAVRRRLTESGASLVAAVIEAAESLAATLDTLDDPYLRARAADVRGVGEHIVSELRGGAAEVDIPAGAIVAAEDVAPAQVVLLQRRGAGGLALAGGGPTAHNAILARGIALPMVVGLGERILALTAGTQALLDGAAGRLVLDPSPSEVAEFERRRAAEAEQERQERLLVGTPGATADGFAVPLLANIGRPEEARAAVAQGAEGVGLFRTEFLFLDRVSPPDEDEQVRAYAATLRVMAGRPVIVRTLDVGGDKPIPYLPAPRREANPFLGVRGIRFSMAFPELFDTQLRALLRAAVEGDLRIMLPMVAIPDEIVWARGRLAAASRDLANRNVPHRSEVPLGVMVETPAAAVSLDRLKESGGLAFSSIGSNDLTQYTLAIDRDDGALAARYRSDDPAVLRMIHHAAEVARACGLEIGLCGELAADPKASILLVGLGVQKLSMAPSALPSVKAAIRGVTHAEAIEAARRAIGAATDAPQPTSATDEERRLTGGSAR